MFFELFVLALSFFALLACLMVLIFLCLHLFYWMYSGVPFLPSSKKLLEKADKEINWGGIKTVYDLGSGNGDVVLFFAGRHPEIDFVGYEINFLRTGLARRRAKKSGLKNAQFKTADFLKKNFDRADLVFTFLLPEMMDKVLPKLQREMKNGSLLVSNTFEFSDKEFKPEKIIDPELKKEFQSLYFYRF